MWLAGTQHHALSSDKMLNYDCVYPHSPCKIFAPPPNEKGMLTEEQVHAAIFLQQGRGSAAIPHATILQQPAASLAGHRALLSLLYGSSRSKGISPSDPGPAGGLGSPLLTWRCLLGAAYLALQMLSEHILPPTVGMAWDWAKPTVPYPPGLLASQLPASLPPQLNEPSLEIPKGDFSSGFQYFLGTQLLTTSFAIEPGLPPAQMLSDGYAVVPGGGCPGDVAAVGLVAELAEISRVIKEREAALEGLLPQYLMLDPARLPYFTYT